MELKFEWDPQKAASNLAKHGVPFEEAATVFGDPLGRITSDPRHSVDEERFVLLGLSQRATLACRNVRGARGSNSHHQRAAGDTPRAERL